MALGFHIDEALRGMHCDRSRNARGSLRDLELSRRLDEHRHRPRLARPPEPEWNQEFKAAGAGSLIAGLGGSPPGCLSTSASIVSHELRAESRLTGVVASLVMGATLPWGDVILMLTPMPLVAGMLLFIGIRAVQGSTRPRSSPFCLRHPTVEAGCGPRP